MAVMAVTAAPGLGSGEVGLVTRPFQLLSVVQQEDALTHWTMAGDEALSVDPRRGDIRLIDVLRFIFLPIVSKQIRSSR